MLPQSVPYPALYLETGVLPISVVIKVRRLNYLHTILRGPETGMLQKVFKIQWNFLCKGYWIHQIKASDKTRNRQACRDDYVHNVHTAGLHTSDRLLLEAVREVNLFDHAGIRTGDPRSDRL